MRLSAPLCHQLIKSCDDATGISVLRKNSFNLRGELIVTTPLNAFNTFANCELDFLELGIRVVCRTW